MGVLLGRLGGLLAQRTQRGNLPLRVGHDLPVRDVVQFAIQVAPGGVGAPCLRPLKMPRDGLRIQRALGLRWLVCFGRYPACVQRDGAQRLLDQGLNAPIRPALAAVRAAERCVAVRVAHAMDVLLAGDAAHQPRETEPLARGGLATTSLVLRQTLLDTSECPRVY